MIVRATLSLPPSVNAMYNPFCRKCRSGAHASLIVSAEGREWKDRADRALKEHGPGATNLLAGPVAFAANVYQADRRRDLDGHVKAVLDAMKGRVWNDDRQVDLVVFRKLIDKHNPRIEFAVSPEWPELDLFADPWRGKEIEF